MRPLAWFFLVYLVCRIQLFCLLRCISNDFCWCFCGYWNIVENLLGVMWLVTHDTWWCMCRILLFEAKIRVQYFKRNPTHTAVLLAADHYPWATRVPRQGMQFLTLSQVSSFKLHQRPISWMRKKGSTTFWYFKLNFFIPQCSVRPFFKMESSSRFIYLSYESSY